MSDSGCMSAAGRARFDKHSAVTISGFLFCQISFFLNARFLTLTQNEGERCTSKPAAESVTVSTVSFLNLSKDWLSPFSMLPQSDSKINELCFLGRTTLEAETNVAGLKAEAPWTGCRRCIWRGPTADRYWALLQRALLHRLSQAVWQTLLLQICHVLLCTGNATLGPAACQL